MSPNSQAILAGSILALAAFLPASEIDGTWSSPTDSHHAQHAVGGAVIGGTMRLVLEPIAPGRYRFSKVVVSTLVAFAANVMWERVTEQDGRAVFDPADVGWGTLGGAAGATGIDLGITGIRALIEPRRDGGAVGLAWRF